MYQEGTGEVVLYPEDAAAAARAYAAYHGLSPEAINAAADDATVSVQLQHDVPTVFIRVVRIDTITIRAFSAAHARYGVDSPLNGG